MFGYIPTVCHLYGGKSNNEDVSMWSQSGVQEVLRKDNPIGNSTTVSTTSMCCLSKSNYETETNFVFLHQIIKIIFIVCKEAIKIKWPQKIYTENICQEKSTYCCLKKCMLETEPF